MTTLVDNLGGNIPSSVVDFRYVSVELYINYKINVLNEKQILSQ